MLWRWSLAINGVLSTMLFLTLEFKSRRIHAFYSDTWLLCSSWHFAPAKMSRVGVIVRKMCCMCGVCMQVWSTFQYSRDQWTPKQMLMFTTGEATEQRFVCLVWSTSAFGCPNSESTRPLYIVNIHRLALASAGHMVVICDDRCFYECQRNFGYEVASS